MINLTIDSVSDVVMARGALRHHLGKERPATLSRDHSEALERAIVTAFGAVVMGLLPFVADYSTEDDQLRVELKRIDERLARGAVEAATVLYTLHLVYEGVDADFSRESLEDFDKLIGGIRELGRGEFTARLTPRWW